MRSSVAAALIASLVPGLASGAPIVDWGGAATGQPGGDFASQIEVADDTTDKVAYAQPLGFVDLMAGEPLTLDFRVRTAESGQKFTAAVAFYDARERWLAAGTNLDVEGIGEPEWRRWRVTYRQLPEGAVKARVLLSPTLWQAERTGTAWFAEVDVSFGEPWAKARGVPVGTAGGLTVWVNRPEQRVGPDMLPPTGEAGGADLAGIRGEIESFQIGLRAPGAAANLVRIAASPLVSDSHRIPASWIELREAALVRVREASDPVGTTGRIPDPLLPLELPVTAWAGESKALWVSVRIPRDAVAGDYTGTIELLLQSGETLTVPVSLRVFDADLPAIPALDSAFEVPLPTVAKFHGVAGDPDATARLAEVYLAELARARLNATDPTRHAPMEVEAPGWGWRGGRVVEGARSPRAMALDSTGSAPADRRLRTLRAVPVLADEALTLRWQARSSAGAGGYRMIWTAVDQRDRTVWSKGEDFRAGPGWAPQRRSLPIPSLPSTTVAVYVEFAANWGPVALDDVSLVSDSDPKEPLIPNGDFEVDPSTLTFELWSDRFERAAARAFGPLGQQRFRLEVPGFPGGRREQIEDGLMLGFADGTPEHAAATAASLRPMLGKLAERGWLKRAYLYHYDEPGKWMRPRLRDHHDLLAELAPGVPRLLTLGPGGELQGVVDSWVPVVTHLEGEAAAEAQARGEEVWTYVSCCMEWPSPTLMLDHPVMQSRVLPLIAWEAGLDGLLYWSIAHWERPGEDLPDAYSDPMIVLPDGDTVGNGDGRLLYPPPNFRSKDPKVEAPLRSIRWELLREGMEDVDRVVLLASLLEAAGGGPEEALLSVPEDVLSGRSFWTEDPARLEAWRRAVGEALAVVRARVPAEERAALGQDGPQTDPEPQHPLPPLPPFEVPLHRRSERAAFSSEQAASRAAWDARNAQELRDRAPTAGELPASSSRDADGRPLRPKTQ